MTWQGIAIGGGTTGSSGNMSRARFLRLAALGLLGAATACTPLRIVLSAYPSRFDDDEELVDRVLRAFVECVIPGVPLGDPNLVRAFSDPNYPFKELRGFFVSDLCARSEHRFGLPFHLLTRDKRALIVRAALDGDSTTARVYRGAVFLTQVSVYAGIYDDAHGCPLIDFHGAGGVGQAYNAESSAGLLLLAIEATNDGNPN